MCNDGSNGIVDAVSGGEGTVHLCIDLVCKDHPLS
jgi:hypothetical protein